MDESSRRFPTSVEELRRLVTERLKQAHETMQQENRPRPELDELLAELRTRDPDFAKQAEEYIAAMQDPDFIEAQIEYLWDQARQHDHTVAEELEYILGGGKPAVNEYRNRPGSLPPPEEFAAFRAALADPRTFIDLGLAQDVHGSHTHAFQEFLGDRLWGRGKGREFRQKLAALEGPSKPVHERTPREYQQPFWSRMWDATFDTSWPNIHSPEVLGRILQELVDFPRWQALPPEP
jgi:hypothetical protein